MQLNQLLSEDICLIQASTVAALASAAQYVSLKNYRKATIIIDVANAATGITGAAISLQQAKTVAGGSVKTLPFTRMLANLDIATNGQAPSALVETAVTSNTFTTSTAASARQRYVIDLDSEDLDSNNEFDCFRVNAASGAGLVGVISYILWGARYNGADPTID